MSTFVEDGRICVFPPHTWFFQKRPFRSARPILSSTTFLFPPQHHHSGRRARAYSHLDTVQASRSRPSLMTLEGATSHDGDETRLERGVVFEEAPRGNSFKFRSNRGDVHPLKILFSVIVRFGFFSVDKLAGAVCGVMRKEK